MNGLRAHEAELRERLAEAVVQDFLDDLPEPLSVSALAVRLRVSRASVMHHVRRGNLVASRVRGRWIVDPRASDRYLRQMVWSIGGRRPPLPASAFEHPQTLYVALRGSALDRLAELMDREESSAQGVIERLLASSAA